MWAKVSELIHEVDSEVWVLNPNVHVHAARHEASPHRL
jgi:hypothetical protein